ncbi:unnamed protein product [Fusarium graminearum]|uniref:Chromosome 3, complete genome n=1 Tax=Gibberella zeae (strain ATCC MYA-4620 / CBS 123657 / FGSC 9075 / NRRL 31084 / PH-1) TaxID=229533 RepID=A0A098DY92_GIBZE|nr:unnamed protein product [Fusarium graminearum]CZS85048.1 unnamed protein product [Fusarium graminearum]
MSMSPLPAVMLQKKVKQSETRSVEVRLVVGAAPYLLLSSLWPRPCLLSCRGEVGQSYHVQIASIPYSTYYL